MILIGWIITKTDVWFTMNQLTIVSAILGIIALLFMVVLAVIAKREESEEEGVIIVMCFSSILVGLIVYGFWPVLILVGFASLAMFGVFKLVEFIMSIVWKEND